MERLLIISFKFGSPRSLPMPYLFRFYLYLSFEPHFRCLGGVRCSRVGAVALYFCVCREWHLSRIFSTSFIDLAQCDCHFPSLFEALRISSIWKFWFVSALLGKTLYAIIISFYVLRVLSGKASDNLLAVWLSPLPTQASFHVSFSCIF